MSAPVPGNNPKIISTRKPKDLRSRRCSRCDLPALYVFGARGYCAAHVREVKGFRPGRADVHVEFDYATAEQAERMYEAFYEGGARLATDFGASAARRRLSMAQVQEVLLVHRDSPEGALLAVCSEAVER